MKQNRCFSGIPLLFYDPVDVGKVLRRIYKSLPKGLLQFEDAFCSVHKVTFKTCHYLKYEFDNFHVMPSPLQAHHRPHHCLWSNTPAVSSVYIICRAPRNIWVHNLPWSCKQSLCSTLWLTNRTPHHLCTALTLCFSFKKHVSSQQLLPFSVFLFSSLRSLRETSINKRMCFSSLPQLLPQGRRRSTRYQERSRTSLALQWSKLHASNTADAGLIPGLERKWVKSIKRREWRRKQTELDSILGQAANNRLQAWSPSQWTLNFVPGVYRNGRPMENQTPG